VRVISQIFLNTKGELTWANVVINKSLAKFRQDFNFAIAGVDSLDDLMTGILGGSMENQVAEDSCANDSVRFQGVSDLCLEVEANPVCTECVGFQLSHYRAIDGRDIGGREMDARKLRLRRHDDGKGSRSGNLRERLP
jgi:hypothetical protein